MKLTRFEIVNYISAVATMILFFVGSFNHSLFGPKLLMLFLSDFIFLFLGLLQKSEDKCVKVLDSIVFGILVLMNVSLFFCAKYIDNSFSAILYVYTVIPFTFVMIIAITIGFIKRNRKERRLVEINATHSNTSVNQFSNTEIEKEFIKKFREKDK